MIDALRKNEIDVAFLWSICPETFSFTLYEALASGCYIVTNSASGNIQDTILRNPQWGKIYASEIELLEAFEEGSILQDFKHFNESDRRTGRLILAKDNVRSVNRLTCAPPEIMAVSQPLSTRDEAEKQRIC